MRIWIFCCILFLVRMLRILISEQYEGDYLAVESDNKQERFNYFGCVHLKNIVSTRTEIDLEELRFIFHRFLNKTSIDGQFDKRIFKEAILNRTSSADNVVILRNHICVILNTKDELQNFYFWILVKAQGYAFKADTFDWTKLEHSGDKFDQLIVLNDEYPYYDCFKDNRRFFCLVECFKREHRLSEYFYFANESGRIQLNQRKNHSIRRHENGCFRLCNSQNCKLIYIWRHDEGAKNEELVFTFKAKPMLSRFEFGIQLTGLICLILNVSCSRLLSLPIDFLVSTRSEKAKQNLATENKRIRAIKFYLKLFVHFICLICATQLLVRLILAYEERRTNPTRKETTQSLVRPTTINLVICLSVPYILSNYEDDWYENELGSEYEHMNMLQLENATNEALNYTLEYIRLGHLSKSEKIDWEVTQKVLWNSDTFGLNRCFQLAIYPQEPRYRMLLSISKLEVKFKAWDDDRPLYLLANNEVFNEESFKYRNDLSFLLRTKKKSRLNGNCIDFEEVYSDLRCMNRRSCIERCIVKRFFNISQKLTTGIANHRVILDKDLFDPMVWRAAYLAKKDEYIYEETVETVLKKITAKCENEILRDDPCSCSGFESSVQVYPIDDSKLEMDLYYTVIRSLEDEPSWVKLLLDILSIQSIFFGMTVLKLLRSIYSFAQIRFKLRESKIVLFLIYLICSLGCSWQTYNIFNEVLTGNLTFSQHYELAQELQMPDLVFCFSINSSQIDTKQKLTGDYLERLTNEMNAEKVFKSLLYKDNANRWIEAVGSNRSAEIFEIESFYFLSTKW